MTRIQLSLLFLLILLSSSASLAQQDSTNAPEAPRLNNVRFLLTDFLILGSSNIVLGYERVLNDRLSVGVGLGYASLPKLLSFSSDSVVSSSQVNKFGFNASAELRYYILSENKFAPPHGVYTGIYASYNDYNKQAAWTFQHTSGPNDEAVVNTHLSFLTLGIEIGYQFILFDHVTLDFIAIGAGVSRYEFSAKSTADIQNEETKEAIEKTREQIKQIFPKFSFFEDLSNGITESNTTKTFGPGLRMFLVSIGYNF